MSTNYSRGKVYIDNALITDLTNWSCSINGNHIDVMNIEKGLAGAVKGSTTVDISMTLNIPKAGFEIDLQQATIDKSDHVVSVFVGNVVKSFSGWLTTYALSGGNDQAASCAVTFRGTVV